MSAVRLPLALAGRPAEDAAADWERFLARRESLTSRMALAVCDGCSGCATRCAADIAVTRAERDAALAHLATLPEAEVRRVLSQNKTLPWPGAEDTGATIACCRYWDTATGRCLVYAARPTVCRLFGHTEWLPCPIDAVPSRPVGTAELWREYRSFERRTWDDWDRLLQGPDGAA